METTTDSKEVTVIDNPRNIDIVDQSRIDTSVNQDPQVETTAIFARNNESENAKVSYAETEAVIDADTNDDANAETEAVIDADTNDDASAAEEPFPIDVDTKEDANAAEEPFPIDVDTKEDANAAEEPFPIDVDTKEDANAAEEPFPIDVDTKEDANAAEEPFPIDVDTKEDANAAEEPFPIDVDTKEDPNAAEEPFPIDVHTKEDANATEEPFPIDVDTKEDANAAEEPFPNDVDKKEDANAAEEPFPIDVDTKEDANAAEEPFPHEDPELNTDIEPNLRNALKFGCTKILTVSDSEDQKSNSSTSKDEPRFSHDPIDPSCIPESDSVNTAGTNEKSTESIMLESEPKKGNDFKKAAAVITQQNYENTLRCQTHDLKSEIIENNSCFQYEDEDNTKQENAFDLSEDASLEKDNSHEENVQVRLKKIEKVVTISDDDSSQSVNSSEKSSKLNSPQNLSKEDYVNSGSPEIIMLAKGSQIIDLDDESQNSADNSKCFKSTYDNQDEKKHDSNLERALIYNMVNDVNSKESESEATDENMEEGKVNEVPLTKYYAHNNNDGVRQINEEEVLNTQENETLVTKHAHSSIDSKTNSPNEYLETERKLNGAHQMPSSPIRVPQLNDNTGLGASVETETRNLKRNDLLTADDNNESDRFDKTAAEKMEVDDMDYDSDSKYKPVLSKQAAVTDNDLNRVNSDDENSRCSSPVSEESNSTDTSSSHQLVIDHPMEEIDAGVSEPYIGAGSSTPCIKTQENPEKSNAVKLSLKRKLSCSSESGLSPQNKQPHFELEPFDNKNIGLPQNKENIETLNEPVKEEQVTEILERSHSDTAIEHPPFKSLLLQHLQKPYTPPLPPDKVLDVTTPNTPPSQPLEKSLFNKPLTIIPAKVSNVIENVASPTKYLCFKCKTGCFDSFAALNEHQRECLADTRLLPSRLAEIGNLLPILLPPVLATPPPSASPDATEDMPIAKAVPTPTTQSTTETVAQKKRYYKCSSCNTFHENWNLFLHIRDVHQRHMCLYCIRFFPTAEKLSVHLEIKHDLEQNHFNSEEALRKTVSIAGDVANETRFLMCCTCQHLFEESEPFSDHNCAEFMKPCTLCGQKGRHSNQCKAHPDAKRTSKTKKKSKKLVHNAPTSVPERSHNVFSSLSFVGGTSNATSFNCDSNQNSVSTAVAPTGAELAPEAPLHCEDSNSNMVIDESCTTTHSSLVNPFKELDERWRLEQQTQTQNESSSALHAKNGSPAGTKLTVPKLKLRVPKEFQKSVDAALSSTDSEDDEDEEENESGTQGEASNYKNDISVEGTTSGLPNENIFRLQADYSNATPTANMQQFSQKRIEDENSQETRPVDKNEWEDGANPDLVRILQEIERTKLDIQRTKQTLHHPSKAKHDPSDEALSTSATRNTDNWTPTPPTSPKQACWPTSEDSPKNNSPHVELLKADQEFDQPLQRRDAAGSDAMDIDETITEPSLEQPPRELAEENVHQNNAAANQELNTSSESNLSVNILNSSADTAASPLVEDKPMERDGVLLKQEYEFPNGDSTPKIDDHMQSTELNESSPELPTDGIEVANEDVLVVDLRLDLPLEKIEIVEFVRICLKTVYPLCLYCNHARRIAVNGLSLVLHMLAQHRFSATVDSITAEELKPETICAKLKTFLPELENEYFNSTSYCTMGEGAFTQHFNERIFECFQCRFVTSTHKELYLHNRKMHLKTAILCFMCRANFFSFSEILCHICPGVPNKTAVFDVKFRCCLCDVDNIPSPFRLMVHLRKRHFTCDICLEDCRDQGRLSSHVWKHKLHHLCYRCGIAYRNKMDITKHLFWKHGTESIICKRCLQKRWRHVYHFCIPPTTFSCEVCNMCFSKAMYLKVHKRLHSGDLRYPCTEENCEEKFISRKLLLKHTETHLQQEMLVGHLEQSQISDEREKIGGVEESFGAKEASGFETEYNKNENRLDIKKEKNESTREIETSAKCEDSENSFKEKAELKLDVNEDLKNQDLPKGEATTPGEEKKSETPRKKKKKNKRSKESLEDLNLIAPNLSETDSSDESDVDSRSRGDENSLVPKVMLSPPSEAENDLDEVEKPDSDEQQMCGNKGVGGNGDSGTGKVLEIWKNFLQAQQSNTGSEVGIETTLKKEADYDDDNYPTPNSLHVVYSDHDYCQMFRPPSPVRPATVLKPSSPLSSLSPTKRNKTSKSPRRVSTRRSASSSSSESSSSSDSSCSCGSNCSCSSSGSDSSSSSSSSGDSDSTVASNASRKRHRKKPERERLRKKSESVSPYKKHLNSDTVNVDDNLANEIAVNAIVERPPSPLKEPQIYESDLETAESETDEEFYDEHPQKLASELLAQKRAQLIAQTRLSPSHNFDIVENSRPSTPSLPEDVVCETTRVKLKKKKRDRKSSCKSNLVTNTSSIIKAKNEKNKSLIDIVHPLPASAMDRIHSYEFVQSSPTVAEPPMAQQPNVMPYSSLTLPSIEQLTPRPIAPHMPGRMSEGSSCSDADGSLKRSKRARRPNKFYGYTSDDESAGINLGQPVMIGMRAIKPQPPPQLTWRKEDLPTPSKSILNQKNRLARTPKTPVTPLSSLGSDHLNSSVSASSKKKRAAENTEKSSARKRPLIKSTSAKKLPPIPTLKIRPSQLGISNDGTELFPTPQTYSSSKDTDDEDDDNNSSEASSDGETGASLVQTNVGQTSSALHLFNNNLHPSTISPAINTQMLPTVTPLPAVPTPQATVFNHKIPPALLPNPNFETLQYFKANNIRYPIRPPAGARQAREGESVYCYCRCPYDEVSEMIACDGENCLIEWFHFECVGIMVAPQGKWFCAECRPKYSEELYPTSVNV